MLLSMWCGVWVVAGLVVHQRIAVDVGGIWMHLVTPVFCVSVREAQDALRLSETLF